MRAQHASELAAAVAAVESRAAASRRESPPAPRVADGTQIQVEIHGPEQLVEFKSRAPLAISSTSVFIPFSMIDVVFYHLMGARLAPVLAGVAPVVAPAVARAAAANHATQDSRLQRADSPPLDREIPT